MPVTIVVIGAGLLVGAIVWWLARSGDHADPVDPEPTERWLVGWLIAHPRIGRTARALDDRVAGGLALVVGLTVLLLTALAVGLLFDMVDRDVGLARWDQAVAEWAGRSATDTSTRILEVVTELGGTLYVLPIAILVAVVDVVRHRNWQVPLFLLATLGGVALVNNLLKLLVDRERPDVLQLTGWAGASFPSGHAATAAAAWAAFALVATRDRSRPVRAVGAGVAALVTVTVAASRALLGVHWLTDVVAGVFVGWGWFALAALVFGGRLQRLGEPLERLEPAAAGAPSRCSGGSSGPGAVETRGVQVEALPDHGARSRRR